MRRVLCRLLAVGGGLVLLADNAAAQRADWTGSYAGINIGYAAGDSQAREINGPREYIADFQARPAACLSAGKGNSRASWRVSNWRRDTSTSARRFSVT
jgi:hypothetical protein